MEFGPESHERTLTYKSIESSWQEIAELRHSSPSDFYERAAQLFAQVQKQISELDSPENCLAAVWCCKGEALNAQGDLRGALHAYEKAKAHLNSDSPVDLIGKVLLGQFNLIAKAGRDQDALEAARETEDFLKTLNAPLLLGQLQMNLGNLHYHKDEYALALNHYDLASHHFKMAHAEPPTFLALSVNKAIALTNLDRFDEAADVFESAERLAKQETLPTLRAQVKYNHSHVDRCIGDYRACLRKLEEAEHLFQSEGIQDLIAASRLARAEAYLDLGLHREALPLTREARHTFSEIGMELDEMLSRLEEARSLLGAQTGEHVLKTLAVAQSYFRSKENTPRLALTHFLTAQAQLSLQKHELALAEASLSHRAFSKIGSHRWATRAALVHAEALIELNHLEEAESQLGALLHNSGRVPRREKLNIFSVAGHLARVLGKTRQSRRRLLRATELLDELQMLVPSVSLRAHAFSEHSGIYHDLIELELAGRTRSSQLFSYIEKARSQSYRDLAQAKSQIDSDHLQKTRKLRALNLQLDQDELENPQNSPLTRRTMLKLEKEILQERHTHEDPARNFTLRKESLGDLVQQAKATQVWCLGYFVLDDKILSVLVGPKGHQFQVLRPHPNQIEDLLRRFQFQIQASVVAKTSLGQVPGSFGQSLRTILAELYDLLVRPLAKQIPHGTEVRVVPHRFLGHAVFEAFWTGESYLSDRWKVVMSPVMSTRSCQRTTRDWSRVLLAGTQHPGLPQVDRELEAIRRRLEGSARVLIDSPATELLKEVRQSKIFHFAGHARFREDSPMFSMLSTVDGGLFLDDLLRENLDHDLVVLSSCETSRNPDHPGEDYLGMARAFLARGATTLVASNWEVEDSSTAAWMGFFYDALTSGASPVDAAVRARQSLREQEPNPALWAGFSVFES